MSQIQQNSITTYYKDVTGHVNFIRIIYQGLILTLSHFPSLFVAVFLRKNMGERFYTLAAALTFGIILLIPSAVYYASPYMEGTFMQSFNWIWIVFVSVFIGFSIKRRTEFKRNTHTVRTDRFSYYEGDLYWPLWIWINDKMPFLKATDSVTIKKYYEPLIVLFAGILSSVAFITSFAAGFLIITAILQFLRIQVQYAKGRNYVLDMIDKIIIKQNLYNTIVNDMNPEETNGFDFFAPRPEGKAFREKMVNMILDKDDDNTVVLN